MQNLDSKPVTNGNKNRDQENSTNSNDNHVMPGTSNQAQRNISQSQRRRNRGRSDETNRNGEQTNSGWGRRPPRNRDLQQSENLATEGTSSARDAAGPAYQGSRNTSYGTNRGNQFKPFRNVGKEDTGQRPWRRPETSKNKRRVGDDSRPTAQQEGSRNNGRADDVLRPLPLSNNNNNDKPMSFPKISRKNYEGRDNQQAESGPVSSRNSGRTDNSQSVDSLESPRNNVRAHFQPQPVHSRKKKSRNNSRGRNQPQSLCRPQTSRNPAYDDPQQVPHPSTSRNNDRALDNPQIKTLPDASRNNRRAHYNPQSVNHHRKDSRNNSRGLDRPQSLRQSMTRPEASRNERTNDDQQTISRSETAKNRDAVALEMNQKELLVFQLTNESLDCSICFDAVLRNEATWSCSNCHLVLHLTCTKRWARSSGFPYWRCPACRHASTIVPNRYYCFCGKTENPTWNQSNCPHSCDQYCGQLLQPTCGHQCIWPCHPGPCPPCPSFANKKCDFCGTERVVECNPTEPMLCEGTCTKLRSCGTHRCLQLCHVGSCPPCEEICDKVRSCGKHRCQLPCHVGACPPCNSRCVKLNACGEHRCHQRCHRGTCQPCMIMLQACMCGSKRAHYPCGTKQSDIWTFMRLCGPTCQQRLLPVVGLFGLWALKNLVLK